MVAVRGPGRSNRRYRIPAGGPGLRHRRARAPSPASSPRATRGGSGSWWAQMAAAEQQNDPGPAQELLVAWNTVSTGLVPPAALGLVRPEKRAAGPRGVPRTLRGLSSGFYGSLCRFSPDSLLVRQPFPRVGRASLRRSAAAFPWAPLLSAFPAFACQ